MKTMKRLGAFLVVVAMLATMSVTVMAADATITAGVAVVTNVLDGETPTDTWKVSIPYTSSNIGSLGVTMLSYAKKDGSLTDADKTYDDETMNIVGIAQQAAAASGSVEFYVSTSQSGSGIKVVPGRNNVVLLGGDGVAAPSATVFKVPKTVAWALKAESADVKDVTENALNVRVDEGKGEDAAAVKAAVVALLTGKTVQVTLEDPSTDETKVEDTTATVALDTAWISDAAINEGSYTASVVVPAETQLDIAGGGKFTLAEAQTIAIGGTITQAPSFIRGDVDGNGKVERLDGINLLNSFMGTYTLGSGEGNTVEKATQAADVDKNGKVERLDGINLLNSFMGTYTIVQ